jgi:hypothetical protein
MAGLDLFGAMLNPGTADQAAGLSDIQTKRQILAAMLAQSTANQPAQMMGQIAARQSPLAAAARMMTGTLAMRGLGGLSQQEQELAAAQAERAAQAGADLGGVVQGTQGTPAQDSQGPPTPEGQFPPQIPGTAGQGPSPQQFNAAYEKARASGVDPKILAEMLSRNNRNTLLSGIQDPTVQGMLPWNQRPGGGMVPGAPSGGAPGAASAGGGGLGGVPPLAFALGISGDPALEKGGAMINEQSKPISGRAGAPLWGRDANGNVVMVGFSPNVEKGQTVDAKGNVSTSPGFLPSAGAIQTQEEAIKSGFKPVTMKASDGSEVQGYLGTGGVFNRFGSAPTAGAVTSPSVPPAPSVTSAPAPGGNLAGQAMSTPGIGMTPGVKIPQQVQAAATDQRRSVLQGELASETDPRNIAAIKSELARLPGGNAPTPAIGGAPQSAGGPVIGQSQSTAGAAEAAGVGANMAKQQEQVDTDAATATQGRGRTQAMRDALQYIDTNAAAPLRQKLAEYAQTLPGQTADSPLVKRLAGGDIGAMQEFTKLAFGNSVEGLRQMVGPGQRISQLEMITNYKNSPNIQIQKAAINTMLDMQDGMAQWKEDKQQKKDEWVGQKGTYSGFEGWWNRNHPVTGNDLQGNPYLPTIADVKARMAAAGKQPAAVPTTGVGTAKVSGGISAAGATPPNIQALLNKYGGQ